MVKYLYGIILILSMACENQESMNVQELNDKVKIALDTLEGDFAVAFRSLEGDRPELLINEHEVFHAASTMKTPVMIEIFKQAAQGKFNLQDSITIKNEFYSIVDSSAYSMDLNRDSGEKLYEMIGEKRPLKDLVVDMIVHSSNLATNVVIEWVDAKNVTQTMRELGADSIQVLRGVEDMKAYEAGLSNTTTAYDLLQIYTALAEKRAVNENADQEMIEILLQQAHKSIIPGKLPAEARVAHKTGWISGVRHDSGIVYMPDGRKYVLVLLSKNVDDMEAAVNMMAGISREIYDFMNASL